MDNNSREGFFIMFILHLMLVFWVVVLTVITIQLKGKCRRLEEKQDRDMSVINNRVTNIASDLQDDINNVLELAEENSAKISELKTVQHNTNVAVRRIIKQTKKVDKKEEVTETQQAGPEPIPNSSKEDVEMTEVKASTDGMTYMGTWEISAYEWSDQPCANGNWPTVMHTCAFNEVPFGTTVYVDGLGYFVNEDICGTPGRLDIFLGDVGDCEQFGIQYHDVYIVN